MTDKIEMPTKYDPNEVEKGRYQKWLDQGVFKPSGDKKAKPYSIVIPPPNVTGKLHLGHAWDTTLQDMIIRQKRMQGYNVLWLPGTDHAGIATQAKVEAQLREKGISRYDLGRKKFVDEVWKWVDEYSDIIHRQWAKMGISVDYSRERFTLDKGLSKAVRKVFVDLYNKGLIYRGEYIINWDPQARTALSDIEVIHQDDKGAFYHVKYFFVDPDYTFNGKNYIEIATTRPDKKTGETYVGMEAPKDIENWDQDPDVLDTWFSSALWPFSTMGWPDTDAPDYKRYFPTNTLVTGYDIIPFWVSRMIFQSLEFTGKRPFKNVLIHGLIRDEQGRKMSKSLGNGIDPMDVIDKYGTDALRWFLTTGSTPGQDMRFSYTKMDAAWNFINKIWNASRFVIMNLGDTPAPTHLPDINHLDLPDRWILSRLNDTVADVTRHFDDFEFGEADRSLYNFIWNDFCDWYIEMSKEVLYGKDTAAIAYKRYNLAYVLDQILRLMHPIMPFVTEAIWQEMPHVGESIVVAKYPVVHDELHDDKAVHEMNSLIELIRTVRSIRAEANAPLGTPVDLLIKTSDPQVAQVFNDNKDYIERFVHTQKLEIGPNVEAPSLAKTGVLTGAEAYVPLQDLVNLDDEIARLEKEAKRLESEVERANKKLANEGFVKNAPAKVVQEQKDKLADYQAKRETTLARINELKAAQQH